MSKTTKRKHVLKEIEDDYELPNDNQTVVKVLSSKGNNLHEVESASGETYLVSMPTKFRKNIWVKRGDYVLVEPILEGDKVKAEIVKILNLESIKYYKQNKVWPDKFDNNKIYLENSDELFVNTNRVTIQHFSASDSSSSEDSTDSESGT